MNVQATVHVNLRIVCSKQPIRCKSRVSCPLRDVARVDLGSPPVSFEFRMRVTLAHEYAVSITTTCILQPSSTVPCCEVSRIDLAACLGHASFFLSPHGPPKPSPNHLHQHGHLKSTPGIIHTRLHSLCPSNAHSDFPLPPERHRRAKR